MDSTVNVKKFRSGTHKGRTMLVNDGMPVLVSLHVRDAESAPQGTRQKAAFIAPIGDKVVPMPLAQATLGVRGLAVEFRLESN